MYVVYADDRPARSLRVSAERPALRAGEFCLKGEWRGHLRFPALEQVFVTPERGLLLERSLTDHLAEVAVTGSCRAVIIGLVAR